MTNNEFSFDGQAVPFEQGMTLASALILNGIKSVRRTRRENRDRGPFCMMGSCYDCLVSVNGEPNIQACQVEAKPGLVVESTPSEPRLGFKEL